jgi:hypothetical protein
VTYPTLMEVLTYGDRMTLPGGIALRDRLNDNAGPRYIVQKFTTDRETGTARNYFGTTYGDTLGDGLEILGEAVKRAEYYDTGGSINPTGIFAGHNPAWPDSAWKPEEEEVA